MSDSPGDRAGRWQNFLSNVSKLVTQSDPLLREGTLTRATGMIVHATGLKLPVGSICKISVGSNGATVEAEVVGFIGDELQLMPATPVDGISPGATIRAVEPEVKRPRLDQLSHAWRRSTDQARHLPIGPGLLGRILDARGVPIDGLGPLGQCESQPIRARPVNAMQRKPIDKTLDIGVRAINGLLTVGQGQRLGLFAQAGVGKSVLMGMMATHTKADVIVVGLIGERGREVREFIENTLGPSARQRATVIAAPADEPPLLKIQAAVYATAVAEYYRSQGLQVLLMMDSLTRYAMAMREVALAAGEPPATRGYPPSVFAKMPEIIERAGNGVGNEGSITAFYTVLVDSDEVGDPVGDAARSFLDGHIVLSPALAESGHYPAIDIDRSISRVMASLVNDKQLEQSRRVKAAWSHLRRNKDLVSVGAYVAGSDPQLDSALANQSEMNSFLQQDARSAAPMDQSIRSLERLAGRLVTGMSGGTGPGGSQDNLSTEPEAS
ncbi:MAG: FliI/YscN family ATPase [Burkholderiaceae bacterium]